MAISLIRIQRPVALAALGLLIVSWYLAADATADTARCSGIVTTAAGVKQCLEPRHVFRDCATCPEMTVVPPGAFQMGSPPGEEHRSSAEGPQHPVEIAHWLAVGTFEVTFAEWDTCVAEGGCRHQPRDPGWGRDRRPAVNVSWQDVTAEFLPWLSNKTGEAYRLLTEAEWEYAARAGTSTAFSTGATITASQANFDGTSSYAGSPRGPYRQQTLDAGSFPANAFGLHDVHGNVWEWVQ